MGEHRNQHFEIAVLHLEWFKEEGNKFLESIVTSNET
jgi:hypothetical protein